MELGVFKTNIEQQTLDNKDYRRVIFTGRHTQLVLMSLVPQEEIDLEKHSEHDQFIRIESGHGRIYIGKNKQTYRNLTDGDAVIIPAGTWHRIKNTSTDKRLSLYTLYSPPEHPSNTVQKSKN